jgi:hypothetical protein
MPNIEIAKPDLVAPAVNDLKGTNHYWCNECEAPHARATHVLNECLPKPALKFWAEKIGREGMWEVLSAQEPEGLLTLQEAADKQKELGLDTEAYADDARDRGTRVHAALEEVTKKDPVGDPTFFAGREEPDEAYLDQAQKFLTDYSPLYHAQEFQVAHHSLGYGGTVDALVTIRSQPSRRNKGYDLVGRQVFIDYKTNKGGRVYTPSHPYQLNMYMHAAVVLNPDLVKDPIGMVVAIGERSYAAKVVEYEPGKVINLMNFFDDLTGDIGA